MCGRRTLAMIASEAAEKSHNGMKACKFESQTPFGVSFVPCLDPIPMNARTLDIRSL